MITKLHARNYRSLGDVEIEFGRLTVLVGPNGSGKSNIVDALRFLTDAFTLGLDAAIVVRHGIEQIRRWSPSRPRNVVIGVGFDGVHGDLEGEWRGNYEFEVRSEREGLYQVKREAYCGYRGDSRSHYEVRCGRAVSCSDERLEGAAPGPTALLAPLVSWHDVFGFTWAVRRFGFYSIFPDVLREPHKPSSEHPLYRNGFNLCSVLRGMHKQGSPGLGEAVRALGQLVPGVRDIKVVQLSGHLVLRLLHEDGDARTHWFDASQESDGTLRMLGVLTALYQDPPPGLIAIEEPELTIHPGALALLRDCIVETAQKRTQVIITTHSPELMSLFDVDVLRVVEMTADGTKVGPVAEYQRQAVRDGLFSPGELARIEGLRMAGRGE